MAHMHVYVLNCFSCVLFFATPWTVACQAPLSMGFSKQEYGSGLPCSPSGELPDQRIEPAALAGRFLTTSATWGAQMAHRLPSKSKN